MIRITINGPVASGKTTVGNLIEKVLRENDYIVERLLEPARERPAPLTYKSVQMEETNTPMRDHPDA